MGTLIKIAGRNVLRNKRRTVLSALVISVGLSIYILMNSVMTGMDRANIDNLIELSTSSIKISTEQYAEDKESLPLKYGIPNADQLLTYIKNQQHVVGATPRTQFLGQLSNWEDTMPIIGQIIEIKSDETVFSLDNYLVGNYFAGSDENEIILGKDLADEMGVGVDDYITLYALTRYDSRNADEFHIEGLLNTTDPNINLNTVLISYKIAEDFLDLEGLVTEIDVAVERRVNFDQFTNDVDELAQNIKKEFPELRVETFTELASAFLGITEQKKIFGSIMMLIILAIAAVGIFNSVLMSVYERIREIGVLRAQGFERKEIVGLFLWEGIFIGLLGSIIGVILGCGFNLYMVIKGFPLDKFVGFQNSGIPYWGTLYGEWNVGAIIFAFCFGMIVAMAASYLPSRMASKMEVTKALRFV
ncbi:ABC transporter permease [bacterium]|nr:MAG: ABC transporter permease [bacterium]